jgi:hypothetical protein
VLLAVIAIVSCANGGDDADKPGAAQGWVVDLRQAVGAVEAQLGAGQQYFEVTATTQLTNVFVAVDGGTAAVPYVYVDGMLLDPAPRLEGASGQTFAADQIGFDETAVLAGVEAELPRATIESLSIEGGPSGTLRYVVSARSAQGGVLDIEVGGDGVVFAVTSR